MVPLTQLITSPLAAERDRPLQTVCAGLSAAELFQECAQLDRFRRHRESLYERVRALFFLYSIHRFHLPPKLAAGPVGRVPFRGFEHLLQRRFEEAIDHFLAVQRAQGPTDAICSAGTAVDAEMSTVLPGTAAHVATCWVSPDAVVTVSVYV